MTTTTVLYSTTAASPVGMLTFIGSQAGLRFVLWDSGHADHVNLGGTVVADSHPVCDNAKRQVAEYFARERHEFDLELDLVGTDFQVAAWRALATIPYGTTVSYAQQAMRIGRPSAVRAIGAANGRNPVSIVLPCHRVIGANGSLTGFAGGLDAKRYLLDHERDSLFRV